MCNVYVSIAHWLTLQHSIEMKTSGDPTLYSMVLLCNALHKAYSNSTMSCYSQSEMYYNHFEVRAVCKMGIIMR